VAALVIVPVRISIQLAYSAAGLRRATIRGFRPMSVHDKAFLHYSFVAILSSWKLLPIE
jgi:hypothetical protein